jgi:prepilin-type N-terminal cleavage/methylation domain-containing protein
MIRKSAFTLIETMVVVAIIAIVVAVASSSYRSFSAKSKWGEVQPCISDAALRLENYRNNRGVYPDPSSADVTSSWDAINSDGDCSKHYKGDITVFGDGARYIIAFCDAKKPIWKSGSPDIWVMLDINPNIVHYKNPVDSQTETIDSDYEDQIPSICK